MTQLYLVSRALHTEDNGPEARQVSHFGRYFITGRELTNACMEELRNCLNLNHPGLHIETHPDGTISAKIHDIGEEGYIEVDFIATPVNLGEEVQKIVDMH